MLKNPATDRTARARTGALCARGKAGPLPRSSQATAFGKLRDVSLWRRIVQGAPFRVAVVGAVAFAGTLSCSGDPGPGPGTSLYARDVGNGIHDTRPVRLVRGPLRMHRAEEAQKCSVCHDGFSASQGDAALQGEHRDITFDHGLNLFCLNCHNPANSDTYVYHDGTEIPGDKPTQLCAKCHGPHYRDFLLGVHGRLNGYWDAELGKQTRLDCIECHDPHRPKFQPIAPDPAPVLARFDLDLQGLEAHGE